MIAVSDLLKHYPDSATPIIDQLSLEVAAGQSVSIQGASGCGKSTLLALLAGFEQSTGGTIVIAGHAIERLSQQAADAFRMHHLGVIFQQFNLLDCFNVWDNVAFTARLKGNYNADRQQALLCNLGLAQRLKAPVSMLSGGEQQRVAIAVALANNPPLLLADEPTGELDDATASEVLDLFGTVNQELDTTIVIVTHDPEIAYKVGRVVMIRDGKTSTEIRRKREYTRRITGSVDTETPLEEYTLVDGAGRVQLPREFLEELKIHDRATVRIEDGKVTIVSAEE